MSSWEQLFDRFGQRRAFSAERFVDDSDDEQENAYDGEVDPPAETEPEVFGLTEEDDDDAEDAANEVAIEFCSERNEDGADGERRHDDGVELHVSVGYEVE